MSIHVTSANAGELSRPSINEIPRVLRLGVVAGLGDCGASLP